MLAKRRRKAKVPFSYIFLAPEGTTNDWELRSDSKSNGPTPIRGSTKYFANYLPLVRLAREYPVRYVLCTVAFREIEKLPRSLRPYVVPQLLPFASPDISGTLAYRQKNLEDTVAHYARSRYLERWLLVDSTYERRNIDTPSYTSLACDPVEGLHDPEMVKSITQWLQASLKVPNPTMSTQKTKRAGSTRILPTLTLREAKQTFLDLIDGLRNERIKGVVITQDGRSVAQLMPIKKQDSRICYGVMKGQISMSDDFGDADAYVAQLFAGGSNDGE